MNELALLLKGRKENDKEALDEFFRLNQGLVYSLIKRYHIKENQYEEVVAIGNYGLLQAMMKFDFNYECNFSTYAVPLILGEIKRYFRDNSIIKVARSNKDLYKRIVKANDEFISINERSPSINELQEILNEDKDDIIEAISSNDLTLSLDYSIDEDEQSTLLDIVCNDELSLIDKTNLNLALESLTKKERLIIELRYFDGFSQLEVSRRLNVSQVQISRLETKILEKLKEKI
ncbi:MAG: sigma-70 family RNA polymerase sigma factor [Bacillales bacterium]|nr:sigma-70 family RNA polymerase sigma factor [Bacillales bacterium]